MDVGSIISNASWGLLGGIAQLGERLNGIQEVSGSIPLISTKKVTGNLVFPVFLITFWELNYGSIFNPPFIRP